MAMMHSSAIIYTVNNLCSINILFFLLFERFKTINFIIIYCIMIMCCGRYSIENYIIMYMRFICYEYTYICIMTGVVNLCIHRHTYNHKQYKSVPQRV